VGQDGRDGLGSQPVRSLLPPPLFLSLSKSLAFSLFIYPLPLPLPRRAEYVMCVGVRKEGLREMGEFEARERRVGLPRSVVVYTRGRESGGSGFETHSKEIPQAAPLEYGHNPLVD
jgi:hypothetical protein